MRGLCRVGCPMTPHDDAWRVRVTSRDIGAAAEAWWLARASGASHERLLELWDDLLRLRRAQVVQRAEDEAGRRGRGGTGCPDGHRAAAGTGGAAGGGAGAGCPGPDGMVPHQR